MSKKHQSNIKKASKRGQFSTRKIKDLQKVVHSRFYELFKERIHLQSAIVEALTNLQVPKQITNLVIDYDTDNLDLEEWDDDIENIVKEWEDNVEESLAIAENAIYELKNTFFELTKFILDTKSHI